MPTPILIDGEWVTPLTVGQLGLCDVPVSDDPALSADAARWAPPRNDELEPIEYPIMRRIAALLLLALVVLVGCGSPAATVSGTATPQLPTAQQTADDTYYSWIIAKNLKPVGTTQAQEVRRARGMCTSLDEGMSADGMTDALSAYVRDRRMARKLLAAAVDAYCPQHAGQMPS